VRPREADIVVQTRDDLIIRAEIAQPSRRAQRNEHIDRLRKPEVCRQDTDDGECRIV
jgi:hypothetical protein